MLRRFRRRPRLDIQSKARLRMDLTAARHDLARTEAALDAANDTIRSLGNALNKRPTAEQLAVAEQRATSHLLELHRVRALLQVEQYDSATTVEQLAALVDRWENLATAGTFGHAARELRQVLTPPHLEAVVTDAMHAEADPVEPVSGAARIAAQIEGRQP